MDLARNRVYCFYSLVVKTTYDRMSIIMAGVHALFVYESRTGLIGCLVSS